MVKKRTFFCFMKVVYELGKLLLKSTWKTAVFFALLIFDMFAETDGEEDQKNSDPCGYSEADMYPHDPKNPLHILNMYHDD